jgi:chromatin remodeling complex protein RSC6
MIKSKRLMCEITPQLAEFLQEPANKKMSRTEITRKIDTYIQQNHLQDVINPTNIYPDKKLMTLLLSAFTTLPLKPYPKMITFEMLRDIISNHCLSPQYEEYYYINRKSCNKNNQTPRPCHRNIHNSHNHNDNSYREFLFLCAFTILFIILPLIIIR